MTKHQAPPEPEAVDQAPPPQEDLPAQAPPATMDIKVLGEEVARLREELAKLGNLTAVPSDVAILPNWLRISLEFFRSGFFFILLGVGLLAWAYWLLSNGHSTFVFIIALMGMSILLFGTGTQSIGNAAYASPNKQLTVKGMVAGGASLLALIFGFGAVHFRKDLPEVFITQGGYGLIEFKLKKDPAYDIQQAVVEATTRDNRKLFYRIDPRDNAIHVAVPLRRGINAATACLMVMRKDNQPIIEKNGICDTYRMEDVKTSDDGDYYIARAVQTVETREMNKQFVVFQGNAPAGVLGTSALAGSTSSVQELVFQ